MKKTTTLRVGKDEAEIRVEAHKVNTRKSASSAKKTVEAAKKSLSARSKKAVSAAKTEPMGAKNQSVVKGVTMQAARSLGAKKVEAKPAVGQTATPAKKRDAKA